MSEEIINAIRLLVEDGAEVTYTANTQQPTDYYQGKIAGKQQERDRIIKLLKLQFGIGTDLDRTEMRDAIILSLIEQIREENK